MLPAQTKIVITPHALNRFLERFRLYFAVENERKGYYGVIQRHIRAGNICQAWLMSPFYKNMIESKYGPTVVIYRKPCYYVCHWKDDNLVVYTVVKNWLCEPKEK